MPTWLNGEDVLLYVYDGSATYNALTGEITTTLQKSANTRTAANKSTSGHVGVDYGQVETRIVGTGHLDTDAIDTAIDDLEDAFDARTKVSCRYVVPSPYNSYVGSVVVSDFNIEAGNDDFAQVSFTLNFDGAPTKSATS